MTGTAPEPSKFSRRWPVVVGGIALLIIGASVGILVERWRHTADAEEARSEVTPPMASSSPRQAPDNMPMLPTQPAPGTPMSPDLVPPPAPTPAPPSPNATSVDLFATALSDTLCKKFKECGLDAMTTQMICDTLDKAVRDELQSAGSNCTYEPAAGERCLRAISQIRCDASQQGTDIIDWMSAAGSATECMNAYKCD